MLSYDRMVYKNNFKLILLVTDHSRPSQYILCYYLDECLSENTERVENRLHNQSNDSKAIILLHSRELPEGSGRVQTGPGAETGTGCMLRG